MYVHVIYAIQKCAGTLPQVRPNILSVFQQVLFHRDPQLDILIVNQLGKLAAKTGVTILLNIMNKYVCL